MSPPGPERPAPDPGRRDVRMARGSKRDRLRVRIGLASMVLGAGLIASWIGTVLETRAFQQSMERRLETIPSSSVSSAAAIAEARSEADSTGLVGRLEIPRLNLSVMIVEGVTRSALRLGVGHVPRTAFPGMPGNVGLAGHRDTFLRSLSRVQRGDSIRIRTPVGLVRYTVDSVFVVAPDQVDVLDATRRPTLTLVTCYPFYWVGPAPRRFVVRARQLGPAA